MSEIYEMLREALVGLEPYHLDEGRDALEASVRKFETRLRTIRFMAIFAVTFGAVAMIAGIVLFAGAAATPAKPLLCYAGLAAFGFSLIGFSKMWFAHMLNHIALMKELKATQLRIVEFGAVRS